MSDGSDQGELDADAKARLRVAQTNSLLAHTSIASVISTVAALILAVYMAPTVGRWLAYGWFAVKVASALPRFAMGVAWQRDFWPQRLIPGLNKAVQVSLVVDGAIWGLAGVWCALFESEHSAGLLLGCLSSVAMLATFGLQVQRAATATYVIPMMLPFSLSMAARGDLLGIAGAGGAALVILQTLVTSHASERRVVREFVTQERLRKALVEVQRQSAVKALFLGTMSHELRTPLHGILGLTELVAKKSEDEDTRKKLGLVKASADHLLDLIGALLDVSRIETGQLVLHDAPFDLAKELRTMEDLYAVRADSKGIGFGARIQLGHSYWVMGDAPRLRQVLHNVLGNAIKFTRRGIVTLTVEVRAGRLVFEVMDTGPGISAEERPYIFEAFRQTKETAARPTEGTGLGLSIARQLVRAMGGEIEVSSAIGVGSRFSFQVDLERTSQLDVPAAAQPSELPLLKGPFTVLIVEDNEVNAMIAEAHLERHGIRSIRAHDGREAVVKATANARPDLILMDSRMPIMDGPTACREIRRLEEERGLARVPIIALTANIADEDRSECLSAGMDGFLSKPFTAEMLLESLRSAQERHHARMRDHPLFEFAMSLEDSDELLRHGSNTVH